jgi:hypothetical protein
METYLHSLILLQGMVRKHRNNFTFLVISTTNIKALKTSEVAKILPSLNARF